MKIFIATLVILMVATFAFAQELPPHLTVGNNILFPIPDSLISVSDQPVTGFAFNYQGLLAYCTKQGLWAFTVPAPGSHELPPSRLLAQNAAAADSYFEGPLLWDFDAGKLAGFRVGLKDNKPATRELWLYDAVTRQLAVAVPQAWVNLACWSSDGQKLAYSVTKAADAAQVGVWLLDLPSQQKTRISPKPAQALAFYKNNTVLWYQTPEPVTYAYTFATGKADKLPGFPPNPWQLSPDGRYLAALKGKNLEVREINTGNTAFSGPAAAMGGWLPYNNDIIAFLAPDKAPKITALAGASKGTVLPLAKAADLMPFASVQWSGQVQPREEGIGNIILLAFNANHKLSVVPAWLGNIPSPERAASTPEGELAVLLSNMRQVTLAALMRADDYDETLPPSEDFLEQLLPYVKNGQVFDRPGHPNQPVVKICYTGEGVPLAAIPIPAETVIFKIDLGKDVILGFADGHAETRSRELAYRRINNPNNALGPNGALKEKYAP